MTEKVDTCPGQSHLKTNLSTYLLYLWWMTKDMFSNMLVCQFVCLSICNMTGKLVNFCFKATCNKTHFKKYDILVTLSLYICQFPLAVAYEIFYYHPIDKLQNCSLHRSFLQYSAWISDGIKQCNSFFLCWHTVRRYWEKSIQSESEWL